MPEERKLELRKELHEKYSDSKIFKSRLRPDLKKIRAAQ